MNFLPRLVQMTHSPCADFCAAVEVSLDTHDIVLTYTPPGAATEGAPAASFSPSTRQLAPAAPALVCTALGARPDPIFFQRDYVSVCFLESMGKRKGKTARQAPKAPQRRRRRRRRRRLPRGKRARRAQGGKKRGRARGKARRERKGKARGEGQGGNGKLHAQLPQL
eukprot:gene17116-biopygen9837